MRRLSGSMRTMGVLLTLFGVVFAVAATDAELDGLRAKFKARYPKLAEFKRDGKLGETAKGFVEAVRPEVLNEAIVKKVRDEENADRKKLYAILSGQEGVEPEKVAERNAKRNFENARPGEYLQGKDGVWRRKS